MNAPMIKMANIDPGLCRCCGSLTKFRILNEKYKNALNEKILYSDMIKDCFGIEMSKLDGDLAERLICAPCMHKLLEAWDFKCHVHKAEQRFRLKHNIQPDEGNGSDPLKNDHSSDDIEETMSNKPDSDSLNMNEFDSDGTESDGFDHELDPNQLMEYYSLGNRVGSDKEYESGTDEELYFEAADTKMPRISKVESVKKSPANLSDKGYEHNALSIVRYSYACPFKNRFNHVLCQYCLQYFLKPDLLRFHTLSHSFHEFRNKAKNRYVKLDITRIDCRLCTEKIDNLDDFKTHLITVHKKHYDTSSRDGVIPFKLVQNVNTCTLCGETFPQFNELVKHMNQHYSSYICETCGAGFMEEMGLSRHMASHDDKRYPCDECARTLKSEYMLLCHKRRMHGYNEDISDMSDTDFPQKRKKSIEVDVPCQGCDRTFKTRKHLAIHVRKAHMNYKHICHVCGQKFFTRFALNNHMPTHTGERNFKCSECGKSYPRLKTLKEHMRIHNNDRRYRCHICDQAFVQNCSLKGHMKSKHPEY